jgi:hypothetical protein
MIQHLKLCWMQTNFSKRFKLLQNIVSLNMIDNIQVVTKLSNFVKIKNTQLNMSMTKQEKSTKD